MCFVDVAGWHHWGSWLLRVAARSNTKIIQVIDLYVSFENKVMHMNSYFKWLLYKKAISFCCMFSRLLHGDFDQNASNEHLPRFSFQNACCYRELGFLK